MARSRVKEYNRGGIEVVDFLEAYECDFARGTAIKHIIRSMPASKKRAVSELKKAIFYLEKKLSAMERK